MIQSTKNKKDKGEKLTVKKLIVYSVLVCVIALFQTNVLSGIGFFGTTPSLLLPFVVATAFFDGEKPGILAGLLGGALTDALGGVGISIMPLAYVLIAEATYSLSGHFGHNRLPEFGAKLLWWYIWFAAAVGLNIMTTAFCILLTAGRVNIIAALGCIILPEAGGNLLLGIPVGLSFAAIKRERKAS